MEAVAPHVKVYASSVVMGPDGAVRIGPCPEPECVVGAFGKMSELTAHFGYPAQSSGLTGTLHFEGMTPDLTVLGDVIWDAAGYYRRNSIGNTATGFDGAILWLPVIARNFEISYEYRIAADGGKHRVYVCPDKSLGNSYLYFGSWSNNSSNTIGNAALWANPTFVENYPPAELAGLLGQARFEWRTRTLRKIGRKLYFTDTASDASVSSVLIERCWFAVRGQVGLMLGPTFWVRNLSISPVPGCSC